MKSPYDSNRYHSDRTSSLPHGRIATGTTRPLSSYSRLMPAVNSETSFTRPNYVVFALVAAGLIVAILLIAPSFSYTATMAESSAVATIEGGLVNILRANSGDIESLGDGTQVNIHINDMVSAEEGTVTLRFFGDQLVRLSSNARLTVERYENGESGRRLEYMVWAGEVRHESHRTTGASDWVQVSTPSSNVSIRNATITVFVADSEETVYYVEDGIAWVTMGAEEIFLTPDEQLAATVGQPLLKNNDDQQDGAGESVALAHPIDARPETSNGPKTISDMQAVSSELNLLESPATAEQWTYHIVERGDSFWTIAAENTISLDALGQANPEIVDRSVLPIGYAVRIPTNKIDLRVSEVTESR